MIQFGQKIDDFEFEMDQTRKSKKSGNSLGTERSALSAVMGATRTRAK
jgi:hypothetical protein